MAGLENHKNGWECSAPRLAADANDTIAPWWVRLARTCHSQRLTEGVDFQVSSSGGGLPGRP
jgi:exoribonuclease II